MIHPEDIQGADIIFLLTINWLGMDYRFSTIPLDLEDDEVGQVYRYQGGLSDPDIDQSTKFLGVNVESDSISVELIFPGVNWVHEWLQGSELSYAQCEMSMVPVVQGRTSFKYSDRVKLFTGKVIDPIYGTPDRPEGHVIFSIENNLNTVKKRLLQEAYRIDPYQFPGLDQRAAALGRTISYPIGKYVPLVFGECGTYATRKVLTFGGPFSVNVRTKGIEFLNQKGTSPSYVIDTSGSGAGLVVTYVVALGEVEARRLRIYDQTGGNFVNYVEQDTTTEGQIISIVKYQIGSVLEDNSFIPALDEDQTFWVSWGEFGGGLPDPMSGDSLAPATNLILYVLDIMGLEYSRDTWMGISSLLNRYQFSGYVNDPEVLAWDWLQKNILAYLPIETFNGATGIEPRVNLYFYNEQIHPTHHLVENGLFEIVTGIQPLDVDVVNKVVLSFAWSGEHEQYLSTLSIDPTLEKETAMNTRDPISDISFQRYGLKEMAVECPFIWDLDTAYRVARDIIKVRGLGVYAIEVQAAPQYGYLDVGDVISLTTSRLGLTDHKCQIVNKSWGSNKWTFVIHLESNALVNPRQV